MRIVVIMLMLLMALNAKEISKVDPIERIDLSNGNTILRIHFNYLNSIKRIKRVRGIDGFFDLTFPLPDKWELLKAEGYVAYTPSILLLKDLSAAVISFNDVVLTQFKIYDFMKSGVKFDIDPALFFTHNVFKFEAIQHYTDECEDGAHSSLWSDVDLAHSYLELLVRPKAVKEQIRSIQEDVFDDKQYSLTPLNFVMDKKDDASLKNFALISAVASNHLKYRVGKLQVSSEIDKENHNVIIATKEKAKELLSGFDKEYISDEKPLLSIFFDSPSCAAWNNESNATTVVPSKNVKIVKKGSLFETSAHFKNAKLELKNLKLKDKESVTVAFWFKPERTDKAFLFGFDTYNLMLYKNYIGFNTENKDLYGAKYRFKPHTWHHVVATFYKDNVHKNSIILDGRYISLKDRYKKSASVNAQLTKNAHIGEFSGNIDQFYMFDHALTTKSARKIYTYARQHLKNRASKSLFLADKLTHDINVLQNPYHIDKAIIVIAPKDPSKVRECVYALYKNDLQQYTRQGLDIENVAIPKPAEKYSAKKFVPTNTKIYFKELGFETTWLKGWYPPKIKLDFKVYPDNYFDIKDNIKVYMHYVLPTVIHDDSVMNIYLNDIFANQVDIAKSADQSQIDISANKLFNFTGTNKIPAYLIGKGFNELKLDFSLVPMKKGACEIYNTENLVASVLDDSYFIIPKSKPWIEMPYMEFVTNAQYPYSIYPDLQDTVIYLADTDDKTVSSAMNFIFFLTQELQSYPNYLRITTELSEEDKDKNIVIFGSIYDNGVQELSKNAPVVYDNKRMRRDYPYIRRFIEHEAIINKDRLKKYRFLTSMQERNLLDSTIIMQMSRSPYNGDKTVLSFAANSPVCLDNGVSSLFQYRNRNNIQGDTLIYDYTTEEGVAYNIKDKYILSELNWLDSLALMIGAHPIRYMVIFLIFLLIIVWIVRVLLRKFKEEHHPDD